MGIWAESGKVLALADTRKSGTLINRFRRCWIQQSMPARDADLTPEEWTELTKHYTSAAGMEEAFDALIEQDVLE